MLTDPFLSVWTKLAARARGLRHRDPIVSVLEGEGSFFTAFRGSGAVEVWEVIGGTPVNIRIDHTLEKSLDLFSEWRVSATTDEASAERFARLHSEDGTLGVLASARVAGRLYPVISEDVRLRVRGQRFTIAFRLPPTSVRAELSANRELRDLSLICRVPLPD